MDLWTFLTIIVVASLGLSAYQARLRAERRKPHEEGCTRDADIDKLMQRVANLESIVTDRKSHLKDEIDRL